MELVYKNEKKLFAISFVISLLFWLLLIGGTLGIALIYVGLGYLAYLFAHSAFIAYLKGTGVKLSEQQFPELYGRLKQCCHQVGMEVIPETYLLRTDVFNALATRFRGRNFVILFSDVVEALEDHPEALNFYIGHELGHLHRKHLQWGAFLMPSSALPLLGAAYRRAEEYTCDRYGVACCQSEEDIRRALAAIAAGNSGGRTINLNAYLDQVAETKGFWMSFHELTGDYPWLTKRMATSIAMKRGSEAVMPRRSLLAWVLASFIPRFGMGGGASLLVTVAMIGILVAVAIPAYQDFTKRAQYSDAYFDALEIKSVVQNYQVEHQEWPESLTAIGYESDVVRTGKGQFEISLYSGGMIGIKVGEDGSGEARYLVIEPTNNEGEVTWICYGQNLDQKYLPSDCRD